MPPVCPKCGTPMNYNGYNTYEKRGLGSVKIGRYTCPSCNKNCEEERSFWKKLKEDFFDIISMINKLMRLYHVSYQGISDFVKGAPATNNRIENYYSTSLKTHRKKQENGAEPNNLRPKIHLTA
ncbi:hypothetical protein C5S32_03985 [ANME-1 cluster archaeon GoMg1]|nr:hypothetical protein [ANME-1 cluster archaeon GoMg1]